MPSLVGSEMCIRDRLRRVFLHLRFSFHGTQGPSLISYTACRNSTCQFLSRGVAPSWRTIVRIVSLCVGVRPREKLTGWETFPEHSFQIRVHGWVSPYFVLRPESSPCMEPMFPWNRFNFR